MTNACAYFMIKLIVLGPAFLLIIGYLWFLWLYDRGKTWETIRTDRRGSVIETTITRRRGLSVWVPILVSLFTVGIFLCL